MVDFSKQFLRYFGFTVKSGDQILIIFPEELMEIMIRLGFSEFNQEYIELYSGLFDHIESAFIPIFKNRSEMTLLQAVESCLHNERLYERYTFVHTPDGGKSFIHNNREYNQIRREN